MWIIVTISCGVPAPITFIRAEPSETRRKDVVAGSSCPPSLKLPSHSPTRDFSLSKVAPAVAGCAAGFGAWGKPMPTDIRTARKTFTRFMVDPSRSDCTLLRHELSPPSRVHIAQYILQPGVLGMFGQMFARLEVAPARVAQQRGQRHLLRARGVRHFVLHRAGRRVGRLPRPHAARRELDVPAEGPLARLRLTGEAVEVVAQKLLRRRPIDPALVLFHQYRSEERRVGE